MEPSSQESGSFKLEVEPAQSSQEADPLDCKPLNFLLGPTASGKSAVALELCERTGAELLSLDSMQVYRGMDIGTAKPTEAEQARVRHHLIDLVDPGVRYSVQDYVADARAALADIYGRGGRALFVGGTALYLKALCQGLFQGPEPDLVLRERLNQRFDAEGGAQLQSELAEVDPVSAERIHANDKKRLVRALETYQQTGRALSDWQRQWRGQPSAGEQGDAVGTPGSQSADQAVNRERRLFGLQWKTEELDARIRRRTKQMLEAGWDHEVKALSGQLGATASQALGYAQIQQCLDGELSREACADAIALKTRQFARRQRTWFRSFDDIQWSPAPERLSDVQRLAEELAEELGWSDSGASTGTKKASR